MTPAIRLAALAIALALSLPAASTPREGEATRWDVGERPRPMHDPAGVRAGSFLLFPTIELGIGSDDNIYSARRGGKRDSVRAARPRLFAASQWRNHALELDAGLDARRFAEADAEDSTDWFASASGRLDLPREGWVRAALGVRELHEERGDPESPRSAARPVPRKMLSARVEARQRANRLSLDLLAGFTDVSYGGSVDAESGLPLAQNDRNRGEGELTARIGWTLASGYEAYARATRHVRRYERLQGKERYDRDSVGAEAAAGVRVDLGATLHADLFLGRRRQSFDDDPRLRTVEGSAAGGALTWNATPLTTTRAAVRNSLNESALRNASGYRSRSIELGADHELRRNLLVGARFGWTANRYEGIDREDDILTARLRGTWLLGRRAQVSLGYLLRRRDSSVERDDYTRNLVHLDVRLHF